jgi:hypothetical protein
MSHQHNLPAVLPQHPTTMPTSTPNPAPALSPAATPTRALSAVPALPDVSAASDEGSVAAPRLRAVETRSTHTVPATVRYAGTMTEGALAVRRQAVTRLGIGTSKPAQPSVVVAATRALAAAAAPTTSTDSGAADLAPEAPALAVAPDPAATPAESATAPAESATAHADSAVTPGAVRAVGPAVPDARAWASRLVQAVSEVLAGDRPISQLVRFTDEVVFADLNRRVRLLGLTTTATGRGAKERSAVRSVRVCTPAKEVAEVAAHVRHGDRSRAIALRMEIRRNRWVCTALEIG